MRFNLLFLVVCVSLVRGAKVVRDKTEAYYWRDYTGTVPHDALIGGRNTEGKPTYIAQVLYEKLLVPGELRNDGIAYYEWGFKGFSTKDNVKILCTKQPKRFQWAITSKDDFKTIFDKQFIQGGFEPNNRIYIGRKYVDNAVVVGKVQVELPSLSAVFHYPKGDQGLLDFNYEILTYTPI